MAWDGLKKFVFRRKQDMPDGLWMRCNRCSNMIYRQEVEERFQTCPECDFHFSITSQDRVELLLDPGSFEELWPNMESCDPLEFVAVAPYKDKIANCQKATGMKDAMLAGRGTIRGHEVAFGVTDSRFLMGSMGSVVGEKVTRLIELAMEEDRTLIIVSGSGGGARMYEGALSLMQMVKTSSALSRFDGNGGLFISVLTHPTMAGVMASYASLGDVILAEPGALLGFTGPRVIQQTIKQELPEGFQTSEFLLKHGFLDRIVHRKDLRDEIIRILDHLVPTHACAWA